MVKKTEAKDKSGPAKNPVPKPTNPNTKGSPNNNDKDSQYEEKESS
jgi:hypothetical protein